MAQARLKLLILLPQVSRDPLTTLALTQCTDGQERAREVRAGKLFFHHILLR